LKGKENVSEFRIASRLKREINKIRNVLYRLYEKSLVRFIRKKDKKKGWYIYYWTFNKGRVKELMIQLLQQKLERLRERLSREESEQFFLCVNGCVRLDFEQSAGFSFKCPECNKLLEHQDNIKTIKNLREQIKKFDKQLEKKTKVKKEPAPKKVKKKVKKPVKKAKKKAKKATKKKVAKKAKKKSKKSKKPKKKSKR